MNGEEVTIAAADCERVKDAQLERKQPGFTHEQHARHEDGGEGGSEGGGVSASEERKRKQAKAELRAAENLENAHIVAGLVEEKAAARHTGAQAGRGLEEAVEVYAEAAAVAETKREEAESQLAFVQLQVAGLQQEVAEKEGELAEKEGELHLQQAITKATLEAARPTNHTPRADYTLPVSLTVAKIKPPSRKPAAPTLRALTLTLALFSESCSVRSLGLKRGRRSMSG